MERTIDWGGSNSPYETYVDRNGNDRAVILDDGNVIFLEKDASDTWQFGSAVNLNSNDLSNVGQLDATAVSTEDITIDGNYHYAGTDSELDDALSAASDGDAIYLGNGSFTSQRTISAGVRIQGTVADVQTGEGTTIEADWTIDGGATVKDVYFLSSTPTVSESRVRFVSIGFSSGITVSGNKFLLSGSHGVGSTVTFESGTSGGLVDACIAVPVTDNGSNTTGDIA